MGFLSGETTTKPKMFGPSKDLMKDVLKDANGYYNWVSKKPEKRAYVNTLPTSVSYGADMKAALSGLGGLASANTGGNGMAPHLQEIMSNGGFSNDQLATMDSMKGTIASPWLNDFINGDGLTDDMRSVADFYRGDMNEAFDPNTIPGYSQVRSRTLDAGANSVAGQAAKMGRLGGAANQGILARTQMDTAAALDNAEYDKWRARRTAGASGLAGISQQGVDNRSGATALKSDMNSNLFNAQASGLDRMGQAYETAMQPYQTQMSVGQMRDAKRQSVRDDQIRQFEAKDPMALYTKMMGLASGAPQGQTATTTPSIAQLLGAGGLAALSLPSLLNWGGASGATGAGTVG